MRNVFASTTAPARRRNVLRVGAFALAGSIATLGVAGPAGAETPAPAPETGDVVGAVNGSPVRFGPAPDPVRSALGGVGLRSVADALAVLSNANVRATEAAEAKRCKNTPATKEIPSMVANIFRCHLRAVPLPEGDVRRIAGEAVLIAHCESLFDAEAVVFDGKYLETPHANGNRYSAAGVFQFIRKTADKWIDGGYANVTDPRANIDAAARLYLNNRIEHGLRGWDDWACAAAHDGFKVGSVLPGWPGGPAQLPEWVFAY